MHHSVPGFCLPHPDTVDESCRNQSNLIFSQGVTIVKTSPEVVKFGAHVTITEAKNMIHVAQNTGVPVPKVFAYYTYGPIDRDIGDYGGLYDTYIFMAFIDGETLHTTWDSFGVSTKTHISKQLASYINEIRNMGDVGYIGSIDHGPVTDRSLSTSLDKGTIARFWEETRNDRFVRTNSSLWKAPSTPSGISTWPSLTPIKGTHQNAILKVFLVGCFLRTTAFYLHMGTSGLRTSW